MSGLNRDKNIASFLYLSYFIKNLEGSLSSALLAVDVQQAWAEQCPQTIRRIETAVANVRRHMPVIWVYMSDFDGLDIEPNRAHALSLKKVFYQEAGFLGNPSSGACSDWTMDRINDRVALKFHGRQYMPLITPAADDWVITKSKSDAFTNPELKIFLDQMGIKNIFICGFWGFACVTQTIKGAGKNEFAVTILHDMIADTSDPVPNADTSLLWRSSKTPPSVKVMSGQSLLSTLDI